MENYNSKFLGLYDDELEAAQAYRNALVEFGRNIKTDDNKRKTMVSHTIEKQVKDGLKTFAAEKGMSASSIVNKLIKQHLIDNGIKFV